MFEARGAPGCAGASRYESKTQDLEWQRLKSLVFSYGRRSTDRFRGAVTPAKVLLNGSISTRCSPARGGESESGLVEVRGFLVWGHVALRRHVFSITYGPVMGENAMPGAMRKSKLLVFIAMVCLSGGS